MRHREFWGQNTYFVRIVSPKTLVPGIPWRFEQRAEVSEADSFSEFVCVLVAIEHDIGMV